MPNALQSGFQSIVSEAGRESVVSEAGSAPLLYRIAKWTGTYWRDVGYGPTNHIVHAINPIGTDLFIGGAFTVINDGQDTINNIAYWPKSGTAGRWGQIAGGLAGTVYGFVDYGGGHAIAYGDFTVADLSSPGDLDVARCSTSGWYLVHELGAGTGSFRCGAMYDGDLHLGRNTGDTGDVYRLTSTTARTHLIGQDWGVPHDHLLSTQWGAGVGNYHALVVGPSGLLYGGGEFIQLAVEGGLPWGWEVHNIWSYDASVPEFGWLDDGTTEGVNDVVRALAYYGSGTSLYAAGEFTTAGSVNANRVAKWDASTSTWSAMGDGFNDTVRALCFSSGDLYAAGDFTASGATPMKHVAVWRDSTWQALGDGLNGNVYALGAIGSDTIYAGGAFTDIG